MAQSRFVNLTSYCMAEYMAEPLGSSNYYNDDFILVENAKTGIHQIFNDDASYHTTKNIQDLTAILLGNNTYAYLDSEKIPNYLAYDTDLTVTPITGYNVVMEKVRFHFVAGFDFDQFVALLLNVSHTENDGKKNVFANILLSPETIHELIIFNPKPLFISNAMYDRFIDILVPSIKNINEDYKIAAVPANTFVAAITPTPNGSTGFIYNNPIDLGLAECSKKKTIVTGTSTNYDSYEVSEFYTATVSQSNEFDNVGAYINESVVGDYIEFYLTFNSGFPEELISILNRRNPADSWIVIHQLSVFEQLGSSFINTSRQVFFQEDGFDEPNIFRPVLKNANHAVSMSIDLICRLTNQRNGEQIIREASFNLISPKKYGKKLNALPILDKPGSQTVYNKIVKNNFEATSLFIEPAQVSPQSTTIGSTTGGTTPTPSTTGGTSTTPITYTEYVPIFFNNNNISIASTNSMVKISDASEEIVFSPGKLRFVLSPFDNLLKFKVYTKNSSTTSNTPIPLDLNTNAPTYKIVFETDNGKIAIKNTGDSQLENLSTGVIAFNIAKADSEIISGSKNRTMYLTSVSQDGRETFMYSGEWRKPSEQSEVDSAISTALAESNKQKNLQEILDKITAQNSSTTSQLDISSANSTSSIKDKGQAPTVNRFGIKDSKSLQATIKNLVSGNTTATSNTSKKQTVYTVAKGDSIKTISVKYGVTVESIKKANNLTTNEVAIGQKLIITF
jgi:LysM repeat protein